MSEIFSLHSLCRCCHRDGNFKSLQLAYVHEGCVEVYSTVLQETFNITIHPSSVDASYSYTICDGCILELRNATHFKRQVLDCEQKFKEYCNNEQASTIKTEPIYDSGDNNNDRHDEVSAEFQSGHDGINVDCKDDDEAKPTERILSIKYDPNDDKESANEKLLNTTKSSEKEKKDRKPNLDEDLEMCIKSETGDIYSCKLCMSDFKKLKLLRKHIEETHKEAYKCSSCLQLCNNRVAYLKHMRMHTTKSDTCSICQKSYYTKYALDKHMKKHTQKFQCDLCHKFFAYKQTLKKHMLWHYGAQKKCICDICGHAFNDKSNMNSHIRAVHEKMRPFQCTACPKTFKARKNLKEHFRKHTGERPYKCDQCFTSFSLLWKFKQHKLRHHVDSDVKSNVYPCKICNKVLETRGGLRSHKRCHIGQKKFECHICNKDFVSKYSLNRHIDQHNGIKAYGCEICKQRFTQKSQLIKHNLRFHDPNRILREKVKCGICKQNVRDMERHMESHNKRPFTCELCPKRYPDRRALNRHIKYIHIGVKPFMCTLCDKKYMNLWGLKRHAVNVHKMELKREDES